MTCSEMAKVMQERKLRLLHRIQNYGKCCADCGETLTEKERAKNTSFCDACDELIANGDDYCKNWR